ncbi:MAG: NAD(P)-dependent glycerol-3-phosphate dehydrogenase [Alphaproteobacteria bacterium]|nr:NAD(P)-dependent glycerol-3-phosphate dehydrogenase [Alphaproteobacteria bacterium]MDE2041839.1 NAD(P)-dependent glycerol-3-phosphate dehydrogenase [Alphaproteobacteria bacterium]MDE2341613.1 NAD(P)-dependent glycerol-3-phosphate dehydrogenase [Alphaproteobacteria bacterium]
MRFGIIGGGAWGTALGHLLSDRGDVLLWAREAAVVESINERHENTVFLPGVRLSLQVRATDDLVAIRACDALLIVTPAQFVRATLTALGDPLQPLILCAKGIETGTMLLMSEVAADCCPSAPIAILSGPTFAAEVARGLPTAITLACEDSALGARLVEALARPHFRPYLSDDVIGAEIGGAVKNVLAVACGVATGAKLGQNAQAALIARGFAEMTRFGLARRARAETLAGLSGLGDLVLTCSSTQSRNFSLGVALGEGKRAADVLGSRTSVAEGAFTAPVLLQAAHQAGVEMPVVEAVCALLDGRTAIDNVMNDLLSRPLRGEG